MPALLVALCLTAASGAVSLLALSSRNELRLTLERSVEGFKGYLVRAARAATDADSGALSGDDGASVDDDGDEVAAAAAEVAADEGSGVPDKSDGEGDEDGGGGADSAALNAAGRAASLPTTSGRRAASGPASVGRGASPKEPLDAALAGGGHLRRARRATSSSAHRGGPRVLLPPQPRAAAAFPPHAPIPRERNAPARAYAELLAAQLQLPPEQRFYLLVRAESGWGNKVRALIAGFKLALATGRIMLVDDAFVRPLFPELFKPPFAPWLASAVAPRAPGSRGSLADVTADVAAWLAAGGQSTRALVHLNSRSNTEFACWAQRRALGTCVDAAKTRVLVLETNQPTSALVLGSGDLRPALEAALARGGGDATALLATPSLLDRLCYAALFGAPSRGLDATVAAAKAAMRWDAYAVHVGVHVRLFVDSRIWRMRSTRIRQGWWECIRRTVAAAQQQQLGVRGGGAAHAKNSTLIFLASDKPAARPTFAAKMSAWGAVRWYGQVGAFVNTRDSHELDAIRNILVDWTLLSDADAVVGTLGSSFTTAAALRSAIPRVVGSLRSAQCAAEARTLVT